MTKPITDKVKKHEDGRRVDNPIIVIVDLEPGVLAEANIDGSIYVDNSASPAKMKQAIKHEKVHLNQMSRGDLSYDSQHVYWKGKIYTRNNMNEGSGALPWEKEAYNKTKK